MPLVLHGGTGIPAEMVKKAITVGVAKVNVNTECQLAFQEATRKYIEAGKDLDCLLYTSTSDTEVYVCFHGRDHQMAQCQAGSLHFCTWCTGPVSYTHLVLPEQVRLCLQRQ